MEEIVIEKNNYKSFVTALAVMFLLIAAIAVTIYGFHISKMRFWFPGIIAIIGLLACFITSILNIMQVKRLLTITRDGIVDNSPITGSGYISFDDIKEFMIITIYNRKAIAVIPKNIDSFLSNLSVMKRSMAKRNINANLPPVTISTYLAKDMESEDILTLLRKRLSDYSSLYE